MRLVKRYGGERVSAACQRALADRQHLLHAACNAILKNGLDRVPVARSRHRAKIVPIQHANLRGAGLLPAEPCVEA